MSTQLFNDMEIAIITMFMVESKRKKCVCYMVSIVHKNKMENYIPKH